MDWAIKLNMRFVSSLVIVILMSIHTEAIYPAGYMELSRLHSQSEPEDLLVAQTAHQHYVSASGTDGTEIKRRHDLSRSGSDDPELQFSDSESHKVVWDDRKSESYRYDHPEANDALYSLEEVDTEKRNDYYEKLANKAYSSTSYKNYSPKTEHEDFRTSAVYRPDAVSTGEVKPYRLADFGGYDSLVEPESAEQKPMFRDETRDDSHEMSPSRKSYHVETWHRTKGRDTEKRKYGKDSSSELDDLEMVSLISRPTMMNPYKLLKREEKPKKSVDIPKSRRRQTDKVLLSHESRPHIRRSYEKPHYNTLITDEESFVSSTAYVKPTRQQFHEQGTNGPHSYKFGYSTGDKENPMARYEEKGEDGVTRGSYSYVDALGRHQVVNYESHPKFGFQSKMSPGY